MSQTSSKKPNIVWLIQDHVVWKHLQDTTGPKPTLAAYERLASEGVSFNRAYTVTPLCTPARASMLTGVYAHKHGVTRNDPNKVKDTFSEYPYFNRLVQPEGYRTGYFGKWHAGKGEALQSGFEGYSLRGYGNPYRSKEYADYLARFGLPAPIVDIEWDLTGNPVKGINMQDVEQFAGVNKNGFRSASSGHFKAPVEATEAYFLSQLACDWLEEVAKGDEPFVMRVDIWGPHQPYLVAEPFLNTIDPAQIPEYPNFSNTFEDRPAFHQQDRSQWRERTGFTEWKQWQPVVARAYEHFAQTDAALLNILDTLDRLGLSENTIVVYTADHGDILASNGGLFDKDAMLTEETLRIPLAVRWPGVAPAGTVSDAFVSNIDVVPTVVGLTGADIPAYMDGKSLVPLLQNPSGAEWRDAFMAESFGHKEFETIQRIVYSGSYKYAAHLDDTDELYDLKNDPFELVNLINRPEFASVLREMKDQLRGLMERHDDKLETSRQLMEQKQL